MMEGGGGGMMEGEGEGWCGRGREGEHWNSLTCAHCLWGIIVIWGWGIILVCWWGVVRMCLRDVLVVALIACGGFSVMV